jgi:hypothetical protein
MTTKRSMGGDAAERRREWLAWGLMGVAVLTFGWLAAREQTAPEE